MYRKQSVEKYKTLPCNICFDRDGKCDIQGNYNVCNKFGSNCFYVMRMDHACP